MDVLRRTHLKTRKLFITPTSADAIIEEIDTELEAEASSEDVIEPKKVDE